MDFMALQVNEETIINYWDLKEISTVLFEDIQKEYLLNNPSRLLSLIKDKDVISIYFGKDSSLARQTRLIYSRIDGGFHIEKWISDRYKSDIFYRLSPMGQKNLKVYPVLPYKWRTKI